MEPKPFLELISSLPDWLRFWAIMIIFGGTLGFLIYKDNHQNKAMNKVLSRVGLVSKNQSELFQLISILIDRYSDNLSNEQVPAFVMLVFKNIEVRVIKTFLAIKKEYDERDINKEEALQRIENEGKNIFDNTMQIISTFKYRNEKTNKSFKYCEYEVLLKECKDKLTRKVKGASTHITFDVVIDNLIIITTDRLQNPEDNVQSFDN